MHTVATAWVLSLMAACGADAASKPNFVLVLTDDQDVVYNSMRAMPFTTEHLFAGGSNLTHDHVSTTICCPSRTELFTGRNFQNIGAPNGTCMHIDAEGNVFNASRSLFPLLQKAGYATGVFGKVTNDQGKYFGRQMRREGMTWVNSPVSVSEYYPKTYLVGYPNGTTVHENVDVTIPSSYLAWRLGNSSIEFLDYMYGKGPGPGQSAVDDSMDLDLEEGEPRQPWLLYLGPHNPHFPATPSVDSADDFNDVVEPFFPSWNYSGPLHHSYLHTNPYIDEGEQAAIAQHMRDRLRSLVPVDRAIEAIFGKLEELGAADNTYVIYQSDHGYTLGEYNKPCSKQEPYDNVLRIPGAIAGPGIKAGHQEEAMVTNIDITPTILDLAGAPIPADADGHSLAPLIVTEPNSFYEPLSEADRQEVRAGWRDAVYATYKSVGTYYSDHCKLWYAGCGNDTAKPEAARYAMGAGYLVDYDDLWYKECGEVCEELMPRPPVMDEAAVAKAQADCPLGHYERPPKAPAAQPKNLYVVDSTESNCWRAIRIRNSTHNMMYSEYDCSWTFASRDSVQWNELYDISEDPYQLHNIFYSTNKTNPAMTQALHEQVAQAFTCQGQPGYGSNPCL